MDESAHQTGFSGLPELPTVKQWAEAFEVSPVTVYRMVNDGQLDSIRIRSAIRICRDKSLARMGLKEGVA